MLFSQREQELGFLRGQAGEGSSFRSLPEHSWDTELEHGRVQMNDVDGCM